MDDQRHPDPLGRRPHVLVGVDGSPDSIAALRAAARAAAARGGTLTALSAWAAPMFYGRAPLVLPEDRAAAKAALHATVERALGPTPDVPVHEEVTPAIAAAALIDASRDADLLVVGSRGHGGFGGLLLGSVSMACTMHAGCPVLVVHDGASPAAARGRRTGARVVVGVGDGPSAIGLLQAAEQAARELDAELLAIAAWQYLTMTVDGEVGLPAAVREQLDALIEEAFPDGPPARLRTEVREGAPAAVLVEASTDADLVVVGRAGRSQWTGVLLGSVSLPVAEHAHCPVLVVPNLPLEAAPATAQASVPTGAA